MVMNGGIWTTDPRSLQLSLRRLAGAQRLRSVAMHRLFRMFSQVMIDKSASGKLKTQKEKCRVNGEGK